MLNQKFFTVLSLIMALALTACTGGDANDTTDVGDGCEWGGPADQEGELFDCGTFTVPVNYDEPDGATIDLTYIVMRATGENPQSDPVVFLAGGPGQSAVVATPSLTYLQENHDVIFMAQRGTLFSSRLSVEECVSLIDADQATALVEAVEEQRALDTRDSDITYEEYFESYSPVIGIINETCYQAFAENGLDPTQFNTLNSARDVVGLVEELGYESYNLFGISYGTRLALEIMRNFPDSGIRSVILDSVATPSSDRLIELVRANNDAVLRLFEDCENDDACNEAYPDLLSRTTDLIETLDNTPIEIEGDSVDGFRFLQQLVDLSNTRANYIPRMIAELEVGETETYVALRDGVVGLDAPESTSGSRNWDRLVRVMGTEGDPTDFTFALEKVSELLDVMTAAENPAAARQEMIAYVESEFSDSANLQAMVDIINAMTNDEIDRIVSISSTAPPAVIDETEQNQRLNSLRRNTAQFLLSGIVCYEDLPFTSIEGALAEYDNLEIPQLGLSETVLAIELANCTNYPMPEPPAFYNEPINSDIPTLILQGEFDVQTPLNNALVLAEELSNETLVIVPEQGHETSASICVKSLISNYLEDPSAELNTDCIEDRREDFSLPDEPLLGE